MGKLISIIVPVYNAEQYLAQCIESILNQSYSDLEILCINDGSTDESIVILNQYKNKDSRIIVIDKQNEGVSATRNVGLNEAKGDYLMFVDADDWIESETCEIAIDSIEKESADIAMWTYVSETETRTTKKDIFSGKHVFDKMEVREKLHRRFVGVIGNELKNPELADSLCPVWGKLYRRELLENISFIDLNIIGTYEDGLFNLEAFGKANKAVYLSEYFYHYRRSNADSVTAGYRNRLFKQWNNLFHYMNTYIEKNSLPNIYYEALDNRIALSVLGHSLNIFAASISAIEKIKEVKRIINSELYKKAYRKFDLSYLPIHWKMFYGCAKYGNAIGIYILSWVIQRIIK